MRHEVAWEDGCTKTGGGWGRSAQDSGSATAKRTVVRLDGAASGPWERLDGGLVPGWCQNRLLPATPAERLTLQRPLLGRAEAHGAPDGYDFDAEQVVAAGEGLMTGNLRYFGSTEHSVGSPPSWFLDPYTGATADSSAHWSDISDFLSLIHIWTL